MYRYKDGSGVDVRGDTNAAARLREAAEVAKVELSAATTTH